MPPLLRAIWNQPGLVAGHLLAYADLAIAEAHEARASIVGRLVAWALVGVLGLLTLTLLGVTVLLALALPGLSAAAWWVPAVPALATLAAWLKARGMADQPHFAELKRQFDADLKLFDSQEAA